MKHRKLVELIPKEADLNELAQTLGISRNTLNSYMYGIRRPKPETAAALIKYLDCMGHHVEFAEIYQKSA